MSKGLSHLRHEDAFNLFRSVVLFFQKNINRFVFLEHLERHFLNTCETDISDEEIGPIFIIGAPRTGSTLLLQLLLNCYHFSYISNIASFFHSCPSTVTFLAQRILGKYGNKDLKSEYGYVSGLKAPSEAGPLMDCWFGKDLTRIDVSYRNIDLVKQSMSAISHSMGGPFLFKSMKLSLKIEDLAEIFPKALFANIKRDPIYTAQSIILTRRKLLNSDSEWWSYELPNMEELRKLEAFEQVASQIKTIWDLIEAGKRQLGPWKFIEVIYDDLCHSTKETLSLFEKRCSENGLILKKRGEIASGLKKSERRLLSKSEWRRLDSVISRVF